jgi:hypothetical protein
LCISDVLVSYLLRPWRRKESGIYGVEDVLGHEAKYPDPPKTGIFVQPLSTVL